MLKINKIIVLILLFTSLECYSDIKSCMVANSEIDPNAIDICKDALATPGISVDDKSIIYITHSSYLAAIGQFDEADQLLDTAFNLNPKMLINGTFRYNWLKTKGVLFFTKDDFVKALPFFIGAKEVAEIINSNKNKARSYNDLGATYLELHEYSKALLWLNKSLKIYQSDNDSALIAVTYANIAEVYLANSEYTEALENFSSSVKILKQGVKNNSNGKEKFERPLAKLYLSIANLHISRNQFIKANNHLLDALDLYQKYHLKTEEVKVLSTLGKLAIKQSKLDKASQLLLQAQSLENTLEYQNNIELKQNLTELYLLYSDWEKAKEIAIKGLHQAKEMKELLSEASFLNSLATLYEKTNQFEKSINNHKLLQVKNEQIYKNKYHESRARLLKEIETTKEKKQILKLRKQQSSHELKTTKQRFYYFMSGVVLLSLIAYLLFLLKRKEKDRLEVISDQQSNNMQLLQLHTNKEKIEQLFHGSDCRVICFNTVGSILYKSKINDSIDNNGTKMQDSYPDIWTQLLPYLSESEKINKDLFLEDCNINNVSETIWIHQMEFLDDVIACVILDKSKQNNQENSCVENIRKYSEFRQKLKSFYVQSRNFPITNTHQLDQALDNLNNINPIKTVVDELIKPESQDDLKMLLVDLMITCIDVWQNSTSTSSLELAEACGFWLVSIEEGQLRTRTMNKYSDIKKIPNNPRWRQVVRTGHYILSNSPLNTKDRQLLNNKVILVKEHVRNRAINNF